MDTRKVYFLVCWPGDETIIGVYSTKEKAEAAKKYVVEAIVKSGGNGEYAEREHGIYPQDVDGPHSCLDDWGDNYD